MNYLVDQAGLTGTIISDSAGTADYHVGDLPDSRMIATLTKRGFPAHGRGRQFKPSDFEDFDYILVMDQANYRDVLRLDPEGHYRHKVELITSYCRAHTLNAVPDPYYGGPEGFNQVIDLLVDACSVLLTTVKTEKA